MESGAPQRRQSGLESEFGPDADVRRASFDAVAQLYDQMRPGYPQALFRDLCAIAGVDQDSRLLEIGCGTGHATLPFARRGLRVDCIELGPRMAAVARRKLARFPGIQITVADFDGWNTGAQYHLVYSASAYQWLNPQTRIERIARLLHPSAWVAVWRNHTLRGAGGSEEFFRAAQRIYAREAPELAAKAPTAAVAEELLPEAAPEWIASGLFHTPERRIYLWQNQYTAAEYVRLLDTHSDHRILPAENRARLFEGLARLIEELGGKVTREQATVLEMAARRG